MWLVDLAWKVIKRFDKPCEHCANHHHPDDICDELSQQMQEEEHLRLWMEQDEAAHCPNCGYEHNYCTCAFDMEED